MHKSLDVKPQSWTHACDIFIVEFFQYGSLSGIVKAAIPGLISIGMFHVEVNLQK
jgi:hypothetical protein